MSNQTVFTGSSAAVYTNGKMTTFCFRLAVFSREKGVQIPSYLFNTKDYWNNQALALLNAMLDRTSGGYWIGLLNKYKESEPCETVENANTSEEEKNTLRVMVELMIQDPNNREQTSGFVAEYLNCRPASEMSDKQLEPLFDKCYLTIV